MPRGDGDGSCLGGWLKNSFIDFPGTVATVLFFRGCNLRCPYCHNPDLVNGTAQQLPFEEVYTFCEKRKGRINGVVLSGGEPTLHKKALPVIVRRLREIGMKIKLDTNGLLPATIIETAPDYLAFDLKTDPSRYGELGWQGSDCRQNLERSLAIVKYMKNNAEVRITVARPFVGDTDIETFLPMLQGVKNVYLQPFRNSGNLLDPSFGAEGSVDRESIERFRERLLTVVDRCTVRGE